MFALAFRFFLVLWILIPLVKKILRHITDYYTDVLHTKPPTLPTDELPNLSGIAKEKSAPDIIKLLRLVLALAVKSKKNEAYVQTIQTFPQERQSTLMYLLQQVIPPQSRADVRSYQNLPPDFQTMASLSIGLCYIELTNSDDAQLRFEEEIARISAEKDTIEKAHLTLMDEHNELKAKAVVMILISADLRINFKRLWKKQRLVHVRPRKQLDR